MKKKTVAVIFMLLGVLSYSAKSYADGGSAMIVKNIEYKNVGSPININRAIIESNVQIKVGQAFSPFLADASIKSLYASGMFDNVSVKVNSNDDGDGCSVIFSFIPREKIKSLSFNGNKKVKDKALLSKISTKVGSRVSTGALNVDKQTLLSLYHDKGYVDATVDVDVVNDNDDFDADITFNIYEGERYRIGYINFVGADGFKTSDLQKLMRTKKWGIFSFLGRSGVYRDDEFMTDLDVLKKHFKNHGYLDVVINVDDVVYQRKDNKLIITIVVDLGKQYRFGSITVAGNTIYDEEQVMRSLGIQCGDVFSPDAIDGCIENIRDMYGKDGYIATYVIATNDANMTTNDIDVRFDIKESGKCFVNDIEIRGNSKTKNKVILRELALAPGDTFDLVRMKNSRSRLMNTGYFSSVDITPIDTKIPERKDLQIDVTEANTGKIGFGGGISTGGEVVGFVEFSQRNFDINSKNKKFQGGGQKFRSRFQIGRHTASFDVNFEEPWWYDRELAIGTDLFYHKTDYSKSMHDYSGANYNESRIGGEVYLRKRLYELWEGRLGYHLENVKIYDIGRDAPRCFFNEEGNTSVSKVMFSAERDTRDHFIFPTEGSRILLNTEFAGVFGETKYVKMDCSGVKHWLVFDTAEQVFSVIGKSGVIVPYGGDTTPFFDRFYLGGSNFMKGFKSHEVGPRDNGTGIGGNTFAYASTEYSIKLAEPIRIYAFAEVGFVNESKWNFSTKHYCTDAGVGTKITIMGMPLRLDFGFPIHGDEGNKHGMRFNYSFGVAF